jgi:ribosome-binding protein aMBF1 (putative translation factor)
MNLDIKNGIDIAIGLLKDYQDTGNLSALTHADKIIHTMAKTKIKEKPGPQEQPIKNPKKELYKEVGSRIRLFRRSTGMSQEELGQLLGLSRLAVTGYETGRIRIPIPALYRIADIFDKPIFDFLP